MPPAVKIKVGLIVAFTLLLMTFLLCMTAASGGALRFVFMGILFLLVALVLAALEFYVPRATVITRSFCRGRAGSRNIGLSFDDGPGAETTGNILQTLKSHDVKATFFVLGKSIGGNEAAVKKMAGEGHEIGNHGYSHAKMHFMSKAGIEREILKTQDLVQALTRARPTLLRTPHGFVSPAVGAVAAKHALTIVGWTRGVWDTDRGVTAEVIVKRALKKIRGGDILLLHDCRGDDKNHVQRATAEALPEIIKGIKSKDFNLVPVGKIIEETRNQPGRSGA